MSALTSAETSKNSVVNKQQIEWQKTQEIFHSITGKKDNLEKRFEQKIQCSFNDIEQLHYQLEQAAATHHLLMQSYNIKLTYTDNSAHTFPTFESFSKKASSSSRATKMVTLEYRIVLDVVSAASIYKEFLDDMKNRIRPPVQISIFTGRLEIYFVDYVIGQHFQTVVSNWFESLKIYSQPRLTLMLHSISKHADTIFRTLLTVLVCYILTKNSDNLGKLLTTFPLFIIGTASLLIIRDFSNDINRFFCISVWRLWPISYIDLNTADKKLIKEIEDSNKRNWINIFANFLGLLALAVLANYISKIIFNS